VCVLLLGQVRSPRSPHFERSFTGGNAPAGSLSHRDEGRGALHDGTGHTGRGRGRAIASTLVDTLNLGEYLLAVTDRRRTPCCIPGDSHPCSTNGRPPMRLSGRLPHVFRSVRFPSPRRAVRLSLSRRDRRMDFHEVFLRRDRPADPVQIMKERPGARFAVAPVIGKRPSLRQGGHRRDGGRGMLRPRWRSSGRMSGVS